MAPLSPETTQLTDWLERMRAGDATAREELVAAVYARLRTIAHRMLQRFPHVKRWEESEDLLHMTLQRLVPALDRVDCPSTRHFYRLAAAIIRNKLIDLARHYYGPLGDGANLVSPSPTDGNEPAAVRQAEAPGDDPDDLARWYAFHEAVEKLPAEQREVVDLLFYGGRTQVEAAELLGLSVRTVQRHWQAAMNRLHAVVWDDGNGH